ncbi:hypothetical protein [Candidatus Foliamicus sp.]
MTTAQLIEILKTYPADLRVVVNGYEQGYDDIRADSLAVIPIALDTGEHEWEGQHGDPGDATSRASSARTVEALVLRRSSN